MLAELLKDAMLFLGGSATGSVVTWWIDIWRDRRATRAKVVAQARALLVDELMGGDPFGRPPRHLFMNEAAYHRIAPFLSENFKRSVTYDGATGGTYAELQETKERLSAEIGRIEARWKLV